ncbi:MAG TPA: hypothetical protein VLD83_14220, partial [Candidatus Binatia bacterium]|nr:hypothetical protein [Candidatus Binatia bacterium]
MLPRDVVQLFSRFAMSKLIFFAALIFFSVSCTIATTDKPQFALEPVALPAVPDLPETIHSPYSNDILKPAPLAGKTIVVNLGPKLVELKASYLEKREPANPLNVNPQENELRRYLNLLATSSFGVGGLTGESELAYSPLNSLPSQCACKDWPRMFRLGLKNRWAGLRYGA